MTTLALAARAVAAGHPAIAFRPSNFTIGASAIMVGSSGIETTTDLNVDLGSLIDRRLNRLRATEMMVTKDGQPTAKFQHDYQSNVEQTEQAIHALAKGQINLNNIVSILLETQAAAGAATRAAETAQAQVEAQSTFTRVRDSYSDDGVLSAANMGATVTVSIATHIRHYLDPQADVSINGGSITGQPAGTLLFVYYDDPELDGGAVTFTATQAEQDAVATISSPYRHKVGAITTPNATGGGSVGKSSVPSWKFDRTLTGGIAE